MWAKRAIAIVTWLVVVPVSLSTLADEPYGRHQFDEGAREHWSFQPVEQPQVPTPAHASWVRNPIDAFVLADLESAGLAPAPPADRATLVRRVYLDLIGLPPSPAEVDAFLADSSPAAFERVVDDLLSRPQYGERWARHWLDVVRYGETNGYERDGDKPQAWKYRDWVIDALNRDLPYDRFVIEQLAGDEIAGSDARTQVATTMLRLGPWDDEPADPLADRYDQLDDIVGATSAAFLGMTLRCARCHDHKFEPFTQKDYARWTAIFAPLKRPQKERDDLDRDLGPHAEVAAHHELVKKLDGEKSELEGQLRTQAWKIVKHAAAEGRLPVAPDAAQTAATSTAPDTTRVPEDVAQLCKDLPADALAAACVEPGTLDDAQKKVLGQHAEKLQKLTRMLASDGERAGLDDCRGKIAAVQSQYPSPLPKGYVLYEEGPTFGASHVFQRGDPRSPGPEVNPGFPAILVDAPPPAPAPTQYSTGRRLQLARWLVSGDHPLTARVMVNRLWQHHFGDGLVATENDFGVMGEPPADQALLDWLASQFVAGGWRIKPMHRLMVLAQTYQMSSASNSAAAQSDPGETLLWRFRPRRLAAEALRDSILAVSGRLNPAAGGPSIYPKISQAVLETQSRPGSGWNTSEPAQAARRSVYIFVKRTLIVPEMEVLDFPSSEESCQQRVVSTVAPQALTLLNGEFMHEQARAMAERISRDAPIDEGARIERAYRLALSRLPSPAERVAVLQFLARQRAQIAADAPDEAGQAIRIKSLAALCLVLLNTNEFAYLQ
jgi:hypothetical protein